MNKHTPFKSTLALLFFLTSLSSISHADVKHSDLKIHIDSESNELLQQPSTAEESANQKPSLATRPLLTIEASPVLGGGFIVTPQEASLPHMSIHIDKNGHMHTLCR